MRSTETHFEQIPVDEVKKMIRQNQATGFNRANGLHIVLECGICHQPVAMETAKTDSDGKAIHEACYLNSLTQATLASRTRRTQPTR